MVKKIIRNGNLLTCICEAPGIIVSLLQATKKGNQATFLSVFVELIPLPVISLTLYFTDKHNIPRLIYCYPIQILFGVVVSIPFLVLAFREIIKKHKEQEKNDEKDLENLSVSSIEQTNENSSQEKNQN